MVWNDLFLGNKSTMVRRRSRRSNLYRILNYLIVFPVMIPSISPHYAVRTDLSKEALRNNISSSLFFRDNVGKNPLTVKMIIIIICRHEDPGRSFTDTGSTH
jgi:hypothetical protein